MSRTGDFALSPPSRERRARRGGGLGEVAGRAANRVPSRDGPRGAVGSDGTRDAGTPVGKLSNGRARRTR